MAGALVACTDHAIRRKPKSSIVTTAVTAPLVETPTPPAPAEELVKDVAATITGTDGSLDAIAQQEARELALILRFDYTEEEEE